MNKAKSFLLITLITSLLIACGSASTSYNGKACPTGTKDKTACNRGVYGH